MIKFNDLGQQWHTIADSCLPKIDRFLCNGNYVLGQEIEEFENNFAEFIGTKYAIGVSSGTDALKLALISILDLYTLPHHRGLIITQNNTYIATFLSIYHAKNNKNFDVGLVDCDLYYQMDTSQLEYFIREYRYLYDYCIIVPVHMYGHCANMDQIEKTAIRHDCMISEDSSHAHGTLTNEDRKTGTYGLANAFSLYPGKNLGAIGEAGIITTDNEEIKNYLCSLRNQGTITKYKYTTLGFNDKLDTIQAIILNEKLKFLPEWNEKRNKVAEQYNWLLGSVGKPDIASYCKYHTYHIYPILVYNREKFIQYLSNRNIPTLIHYPTQVIKHQCCKDAGFITCSNLNKSEYMCDNLVSLPIHPFLSDNNIKYICGVINDYTY